MKYIFLITFLIFTGLHLYASYKKDKIMRNATKGFIVYPLMMYYILSVEFPLWVVVLALLFSWLGDMLLIKKGILWFTLGGIAFMISHFFFILSYSKYINFETIPAYVFIIVGLIYFILVFFIFRKLKPLLPKPLFYPMYLYLLINGCMNLFAIIRAVSNFSIVSFIVAIGAISFFISDTLLFFVRFSKDSEDKSHFGIMLSYTLAELLITLGFIL